MIRVNAVARGMLSAKMTTKPKRTKRPADVITNAVHIMRVLTGEADDVQSPGKNPAAVALGSKGGKARAASLSGEKRKQIAREAAAKRWKK